MSAVKLGESERSDLEEHSSEAVKLKSMSAVKWKSMSAVNWKSMERSELGAQ
jgi:hypothetical protein